MTMSQSLCKSILALDDSIRFVAVANKLGTVDAVEYRTGLNPLLTKEETKQYAIQAVTRASPEGRFHSQVRTI